MNIEIKSVNYFMEKYLMFSYYSLPFEIRLKIAEHNPKTLLALQLVDKDIAEYIGVNLESYKNKFSTTLYGSAIGKVKGIWMDLHETYKNTDDLVAVGKHNIKCILYPNPHCIDINIEGKNISYSLSLVNKIIHGKYEYRSGFFRISTNFIGGKIHGPYIVWYKNKILRILQYDNGKLSGRCLEWINTENVYYLRFESNYVDDQLDGFFRVWNDTQLYQQFTYDKGMLIKSKIWHCKQSQDNYKCKFNFSGNKLHGHCYIKTNHSTESAIFFEGIIHGSYIVDDTLCNYRINKQQTLLKRNLEFIYENGNLIREKNHFHMKIPERYNLHKLNTGHPQENKIRELFLPLHIHPTRNPDIHLLVTHLDLKLCENLNEIIRPFFSLNISVYRDRIRNRISEMLFEYRRIISMYSNLETIRTEKRYSIGPAGHQGPTATRKTQDYDYYTASTDKTPKEEIKPKKLYPNKKHLSIKNYDRRIRVNLRKQHIIRQP